MMNIDVTAIRISGIARQDELELQKLLGLETIRIEKQRDNGDIHGELATATAIVTVSMAALRVLATYLARKNKRCSFTKVIETIYSDGTVKRQIITYSASSAEGPEANILVQLAKAVGLEIPED